MSILTAIRDKFVAKKQEERKQAVSEYWRIVTALADGEDPGFEAIEAVVDDVDLPDAPVCPTSPEHTAIRKLGPGEKGRNKFLCDDCGAEWEQDADIVPRPADVKALADLEADVALLQNRRRWAEQLAGQPAAETRRRTLVAKKEAAHDAVRKAIEARDAVNRELDPQIQIAEREVEEARKAEQQLCTTCPYPELAGRHKALSAERGQRVLRLQELTRDVWGYGRPGTFHETELGSTGSRVHSFDVKIQQLNPGDSKDRLKREQLSANRDLLWTREVDPKLKEIERLRPELQELDSELEKLRRQLLNP